jgi:perosamine synthetase
MIRIAQPLMGPEEREAALAVLSSGQLAQGPGVAAFEEAFAAFVGAPYAVAVSSGTAALHLALLAHGIGPGDEVIVPAFTFAATANAVALTGARPVFADVRVSDLNVDPAAVERAVTGKTRAVVAVHLYGGPAPLAELGALCARHGLALIEDAAQAHGAAIGRERIGARGTACWSFYATKNMTTGGEGGMVTTGDAAVAERVRMLRNQGERQRYMTERPGYNYRMTELAAAIGLVQLRKLEGWNERRRANAARLTARLQGVAPLATDPGVTHAFHQYTVRVPGGRRDALLARLRERGIEAAVFYPAPVPRLPAYAEAWKDTPFPVAERAAAEVLSLPVHPALGDRDIDAIVEAVNSAVAEAAAAEGGPR